MVGRTSNCCVRSQAPLTPNTHLNSYVGNMKLLLLLFLPNFTPQIPLWCVSPHGVNIFMFPRMISEDWCVCLPSYHNSLPSYISCRKCYFKCHFLLLVWQKCFHPSSISTHYCHFTKSTTSILLPPVVDRLFPLWLFALLLPAPKLQNKTPK